MTRLELDLGIEPEPTAPSTRSRVNWGFIGVITGIWVFWAFVAWAATHWL
jgi:hypothetical protein